MIVRLVTTEYKIACLEIEKNEISKNSSLSRYSYPRHFDIHFDIHMEFHTKQTQNESLNYQSA